MPLADKEKRDQDAIAGRNLIPAIGQTPGLFDRGEEVLNGMRSPARSGQTDAIPLRS
jgi:hypothetical protein